MEALIAEVQRRVLLELAEAVAMEREQWKAAPSVRDEAPAVRCLYALLRQASYYLRLEQTSRAKSRIISFSLDPRIWLDEEQSKVMQPVLMEIVRVLPRGLRGKSGRSARSR